MWLHLQELQSLKVLYMKQRERLEKENILSYQPLIDSSLLEKALSGCKGTICPEGDKIFRAFSLCSLDSLKAVFVGQDPYPQRGVATGILFGNRKDVPEECLSPSLKVVKEASINYEIPHDCVIFDNTLESWGRQGILMINSAFTVRENMPGSHALLWQPFVSELLRRLSRKETGLVYVLFGSRAQSFESCIDSKLNTVLKVPHPAWYARTGQKMPSDIFCRVREEISDRYGTTIYFYKELKDYD